MSQGDMEKRTGLRRQYVSRVENGWTMPSLETLERLATALRVPLYRLFYEGDMPPKTHGSANGNGHKNGQSGKGNGATFSAQRFDSDRYTNQLLRLMVRIKPEDRKLLFATALKMSHLPRNYTGNKATD